MVEVETSHVLLLFVERSWLELVFMFVMGKNRFRGGILYEERVAGVSLRRYWFRRQ